MYRRAALIAFSLASAPPRVKKSRLMSPGTSSARRWPRRARTGVAALGAANSMWPSIASFIRASTFEVAVADVDAHQLAVEVEVALALGGVEVHALGPLERERLQRAALRPRPHGVLLAEFDDGAAVHGGILGRSSLSKEQHVPQDIQVASLLSCQRVVSLRARVQKRRPSQPVRSPAPNSD